MPLDLSSVGYTTKAYSFSFDWRTLATYALGIGAKRDELPFLYERAEGGMKVYPTFAVVPAYDPLVDLLARSGGDMATVVHGGQSILCHRPIPDGGTIETTGTLKGLYDLKKFGQAVLETRSTLNGEPLFETTWSIIFRGAGGFGGPRPNEPKAPAPPKDKAPDFRVEEATSPEQALLYRISGDTNPLHADPVFARNVGFAEGPILHGLCTYGFAGRAFVREVLGGDPGRLRAFSAQFRKPVWPGDTLVTEGWDLGEGRFSLQTSVKERPDPVLTNAWAEIG